VNLLAATPLAILIMVGTFQDYWILPNIVPEFMASKYFLFVLTTPVIFGPARQFFVNSFNGLRRGVTDMNLLYATGIGAAYFIAVINTFWPNAGFGGKDATFFESAALLTWFIVLGRYLEAVTRGRTSEAIRKLMKLQPKRARVLRDGQEVDLPADEVQGGDVCLVRETAIEVLGEEHVTADQFTMTAEDMSEFLSRVPGCFFFIGSANTEKGLNAPHHNPRFDIDEDVLPLGVAVLSEVVMRYAKTTTDWG
jgi:Cu+-exporting ATPase